MGTRTPTPVQCKRGNHVSVRGAQAWQGPHPDRPTEVPWQASRTCGGFLMWRMCPRPALAARRQPDSRWRQGTCRKDLTAAAPSAGNWDDSTSASYDDPTPAPQDTPSGRGVRKGILPQRHTPGHRACTEDRAGWGLPVAHSTVEPRVGAQRARSQPGFPPQRESECDGQLLPGNRRLRGEWNA